MSGPKSFVQEFCGPIDSLNHFAMPMTGVIFHLVDECSKSTATEPSLQLTVAWDKARESVGGIVGHETFLTLQVMKKVDSRRSDIRGLFRKSIRSECQSLSARNIHPGSEILIFSELLS